MELCSYESEKLGAATHLFSLEHSRKDAGGTVIGFEYSYDAAGNKLMQKSYHDPTDGQRYAYDSANRLTAYRRGSFTSFCDDATAEPPTGETQARRWTYDGLGNWDQIVTKASGASTTENRTDNTFNEYATIDPDGPGGADPIAQSHDTNGNLTDDGDQTYKWDAFNRLRKVYDDQSALIASYTYDAGNHRMRKDLATGTDIDYHYSGWQVLEEYEGGANPKRQFVYGLYIDEVLVMDVNEDNDSSCIEAGDDDRYFYQQNTLFSVCALTDSSGNVVEAYAYDPYGKHILITDGDTGGDSDNYVNFDSTKDTRTASGASSIGNPYTYTGRRFDGESSLYYFRIRYYNAARGRFISRDKEGYIDGSNIYHYASNNPARYNDPYGLMSWEQVRKEISETAKKVKNGTMNGAKIAVTMTFKKVVGSGGWLNPVEGIERCRSNQCAGLKNEIATLQVNDFKYAHATIFVEAQDEFGLIGTPFALSWGFVYEGWHLFIPGHTDNYEAPPREYPYYGFFDGQHPIEWLYDTPGDLLANITGQVSAILCPRKDQAHAVAKIVFLIPGPNHSPGPQTWPELSPIGIGYPIPADPPVVIVPNPPSPPVGPAPPAPNPPVNPAPPAPNPPVNPAPPSNPPAP